MTDTEAKALALVNETCDPGYAHDDLNAVDEQELRDALIHAARNIEADKARHAAELRELKERFSEVAKKAKAIIEIWTGNSHNDGVHRAAFLAPFILPAPDPLKSWMHKSGYEGNSVVEQALADLAQNGGKIVWEAGE